MRSGMTPVGRCRLCLCRRTCDSRPRTQPLDFLKSLKDLSRFHSAARRLGSAGSCVRAVARCRAEAGLPGASHWRELGPVFWMRGQLPVALALYLWARGAQVPEVVGPYSELCEASARPAPRARGEKALIALAAPSQSITCSPQADRFPVRAACGLALRCSCAESIGPPVRHRGLELNGEQKLARIDNAPCVLWR